jgi:hypothetical protein
MAKNPAKDPPVIFGEVESDCVANSSNIHRFYGFVQKSFDK